MNVARVVPSTVKRTDATPLSSEAEAETVTDPETVELFVGEVKEIVGRVSVDGGVVPEMSG